MLTQGKRESLKIGMQCNDNLDNSTLESPMPSDFYQTYDTTMMKSRLLKGQISVKVRKIKTQNTNFIFADGNN